MIYDSIIFHKIHGFPDASLEAYGSCVYLKIIGRENNPRAFGNFVVIVISFRKKALNPIVTK